MAHINSPDISAEEAVQFLLTIQSRQSYCTTVLKEIERVVSGHFVNRPRERSSQFTSESSRLVNYYNKQEREEQIKWVENIILVSAANAELTTLHTYFEWLRIPDIPSPGATKGMCMNNIIEE